MVKRWPLKDSELKFPHIFLIHSSAGSGKTENLAYRYIQFILSDKIPKNSISNLLAVTFTENSAKEMKNRIINILKKLALEDEETLKRIEKYIGGSSKYLTKKSEEKIEEILDNYNFFNISTIDSFVLKIFEASLKKLNYPCEFDLSFEYSDLMDESFSYFMHKVLKDPYLMSEIESAIDFMDITEKRFFINPIEKIKENFEKFIKKEDLLLSEISDADNKIFNEKMRLREEIWALAKDLLSKVEHKDVYTDIIEGYKQKNISLMADKIFEKGKILKKKDENIDEEIALKSDKIFKLCAKYLILESLSFYHPYVKIYRRFRDDFKIYMKKNTSSAVLSGLTREVGEYLKDLSEEKIIDIYIKLSSFLRHFLIDEFQDTSYSQWSVIRPLIEEAVSAQGSGFFIGDIKQAIYMFRDADYRIINEFIKKPKSDNSYMELSSLENGIERFDIDINYRSSKEILDYVNKVLNSEKFKFFCEENGLKEFYKNYKVKHKAYRKTSGRFKTLIIEKRGEEDIEEKVKSVFIKALKDMVLRYGYSNVAVLSYKNDTVEKIAGWVNELGYPLASYSSLDSRKNKIVKGVIGLLKFLENNEDNLSLYEFLNCGVLTEVSDQEIENIFVKSKIEKKPAWSVLKEIKPLVYKENLEIFMSAYGYLGVYEIVNLIYRRLGLFERFREHGAFLLKFLEAVFEKTLSEKSYSLSNFISDVSSESEDESFSIEISQHLNAVNIMTFHKAKGLQFEGVINLFWKGRKTVSDNMYFLKDGDGVNVLKINKNLGEASSEAKNNPINKVYAENKIKENIAEINAVYVALTRAKTELFNIVVEPKDNDILSVFEESEGGVSGEIKTEEFKPEHMVISLPRLRHPIYPFLKKPDLENEVEIRGRVYHKVISMITYSDELNNLDNIVLKACSLESVFADENFLKEIKLKITDLFKNREIMVFFQKKPGREILIEKEFVSKNGEILRPDRIVMDEYIHLIDFKTGEKDESYLNQIKKYVDTVRNIYFKKTIGYLCYIDKGLIEKVYEKN